MENVLELEDGNNSLNDSFQSLREITVNPQDGTQGSFYKSPYQRMWGYREEAQDTFDVKE